MNETINLMKRHRSVRSYRPELVPRAHVRAAIEAGQAASTSSAVQAYCIIHVTSDDERQRLVELTGGQAKVAACGAFFVICGDTRRHRLAADRTEAAYDVRLEAFLVATIDASLFAQNVALAFESMGYGICYIGGLRNSLSEVDAMLGLPEGVYPLYGLCVGVPATSTEMPPRPRLPIEAVLFEDRYPADDAMRSLMDAYDEMYSAYLRKRGAEPGAWSSAMSRMHREPRRGDLAAYYASKGAVLG
jgi:FMN reductase (NADPH)